MTSIAIAVLPRVLRASPVKRDIGLQLYTLRDLISQDLKGTLEKIAETGYTWLEAAGYNDGKFYDLLPAEFRKMTEDLGLRVISSHAAFTTDKIRQVADAHLELGVYYVVYPWMAMGEKPIHDDYSKAATHMNELGEACKAQGLKFGYHNHDFEFVKIGDTTGFDILVNETDEKSVCFEADLYWMKYAGVDPVEYFKKYPGRFELWHVKDMEDSPGREFVPVGTGIIDFKTIFNYKEISGMSYFFVEQDSCKDDPLESIAVSFKNLSQLLQ